MLGSGTGRRGSGAGPRFDRTGFPMDPKDRVARRDRLRARAVTTTVVATVVAAPVLALWAAYRAAPSTGEPVGNGATRISASEAELPQPRTDGRPLTAYENAGNAAVVSDGPGFAPGSAAPDVSVEVISSGALPSATPAGPGTPGRLSASASSQGSTTLLTLTASGGAPSTGGCGPTPRGCGPARPRGGSRQENRSPCGSTWTPKPSPSGPGRPGSEWIRVAR